MEWPDLSAGDFAPVVIPQNSWYVFDLTHKYDPEFIMSKRWGIGRYDERREAMYTAPQYEGKRNIHMGIDFWAPAGTPVHAFDDGEVVYTADHNQKGNYGPTIVTRHEPADLTLYALHGHLSRASLEAVKPGDVLEKGAVFAAIGTYWENGGWAPHLHFQLSRKDPGKADMPGVVAQTEREEALKRYPDPRIVLGNLY
ncbi:MAG: peptidoglycan DD-metalloendopeptidase family protein [Balneolaceae bacterium]